MDSFGIAVTRVGTAVSRLALICELVGASLAVEGVDFVVDVSVEKAKSRGWPNVTGVASTEALENVLAVVGEVDLGAVVAAE